MYVCMYVVTVLYACMSALISCCLSMYWRTGQYFYVCADTFAVVRVCVFVNTTCVQIGLRVSFPFLRVCVSKSEGRSACVLVHTITQPCLIKL